MIKSRKTGNATKIKKNQERHKSQNCQKIQRTPKTKNAKVQEKPKIKEAKIPAMTHKLKKNTEKPKNQ